MLILQKYQEHLSSENQENGQKLDATIELLGHTSRIVQLFNDKHSITSLTDPRLIELSNFLNFFSKWHEESIECGKHFISSKLWFDLQSMCIGFVSMITVKLTKFPQSLIKPAICNQDGVENHFCQVRACNGQNNNPTYHQQESTQNSIRFGQTTISRKSNTAAGNCSKTGKASTCSLPNC